MAVERARQETAIYSRQNLLDTCWVAASQNWPGT
jgi:hypothetical protein